MLYYDIIRCGLVRQRCTAPPLNFVDCNWKKREAKFISLLGDFVEF